MPPRNKLSRLVKETAGFSYEFIRHPKGVGSVIPSSRMLAKAMRRTAQKFGAPDSLIIEAPAPARLPANWSPISPPSAC